MLLNCANVVGRPLRSSLVLMDCFHFMNVCVVCIVNVCRECKLEHHFFSKQVRTVIKIRTIQAVWTNEDVKIVTHLSVSLCLTFSVMLDHHLGSCNIYIYIYIYIYICPTVLSRG
jgi:hypothetical protein